MGQLRLASADAGDAELTPSSRAGGWRMAVGILHFSGVATPVEAWRSPRTRALRGASSSPIRRARRSRRTDPADMAVRRNKIQRQERGLSEG